MTIAKHKKTESLEKVRNSLDYFIGGVPALGYFELQAAHLDALGKSSKEDKPSRLNQVAEVALIGLCAYFEGFCKAQFASLINICPEILRNFVERRNGAAVSLRHVVSFRADVSTKLGNLVSEEYDFGSARDLN